MQWGTFAAHWHLPAIIALSFWLRAGPAGPLSITTTLLRIRLISCSYSGAHASAVEVLHRHQPPQSTSGVPHTARDAGCDINVLFCRAVLIYFIDFTQGVITRIYILSPHQLPVARRQHRPRRQWSHVQRNVRSVGKRSPTAKM